MNHVTCPLQSNSRGRHESTPNIVLGAILLFMSLWIDFSMTFPMNKFTNVVIPTYFYSSSKYQLLKTKFGVFWFLKFHVMKCYHGMIEIWMKNYIVSNHICTLINLSYPTFFYHEWQIDVRFIFSVDDTTHAICN